MRTFTRVVLCITLAFLSTAVLAARPAFNCQCRDANGQMRDIGTVECISIGSSQFMVRCEMAGNNTHWNRVSDESGCPLA